MNRSAIVLCNDLEYARSEVLSGVEAPIVKHFFEEEFKVEHAQAVIKEAYIAESQTKALILCANAYNLYAQNALLKLLEEPPRNILFILITRSKNALLPTVRSRLPILHLQVPKAVPTLELDIARMDLDAIFAFLKQHANLKKEELKAMIQLLLQESLVRYGLHLSEEELGRFDMALELAELNTRAQNILSMLLLTLYEARMRQG